MSDVDWPICEHVLRSLSENVRPTKMANNDDSNDDGFVAAIESCLAERVAPIVKPEQCDRLQPRPEPDPRDEPISTMITMAKRMQIRLMAVPSTYLDGKYYSPETSYVSRTVEELRHWQRFTASDNTYTYTIGTVHYDQESCHLHGFVDPQIRVAIDYSLLTIALPRHRSTVKMYSTLRMSTEDAAPVLVPHHFQTFSYHALFGPNLTRD